MTEIVTALTVIMVFEIRFTVWTSRLTEYSLKKKILYIYIGTYIYILLWGDLHLLRSTRAYAEPRPEQMANSDEDHPTG